MRLLVLPLLLLYACQGGYEVRLRFELESTRAGYERMEVALVESCLEQELGASPTRSVRGIVFGEGETVPALGDVDPGEYGLYARAIDGSCQVVASGCTAVTLEKRGTGVLPVQLGEISLQLCPPDSCREGLCTRVDGGMDAALSDARDTDGGPDASVPDLPDVPDVVDAGPPDVGVDAGTDPSLVAHYACDRLDGDMLPDMSGNGHDGACSGECPVLSAGRDGLACTFDGTTHFRVPYDASFDPTLGFSVAAWVRPADDLQTFNAVAGVAHGDSFFNSWQLFLFRGGMGAGASFVSTDGLDPDPMTTETFPLETWHHLVWTYDGTTKRGYLDGQFSAGRAVEIVVDGVHDLLIGADESGGRIEIAYRGQLDELLLYNRPLTDDEVSNLFDGTLP